MGALGRYEFVRSFGRPNSLFNSVVSNIPSPSRVNVTHLGSRCDLVPVQYILLNMGQSERWSGRALIPEARDHSGLGRDPAVAVATCIETNSFHKETASKFSERSRITYGVKLVFVFDLDSGFCPRKWSK